MIGKVVNHIAKASADEGVRARARGLVEAMRQTHRKRKASSSDLTSTPKRSASSFSLCTEGASQDPEASPQKARGDAAAQAPGAGDAAAEKDSSPAGLGLQKQDSTMSLGGDAPGGAKGIVDDKQRDKVRQKLVEALGKAEAIETKGEDQGDEKMREPQLLGAEIEQELFNAIPKKDAYMNQARSLLYNLKDPKNLTFRFKLMVGFYKPKDVPSLNAEDMASDEKNAQRAKQRQDAMEEIDQGWAMKNGGMRITGMFTCGKCKGTKTTYFQMQTRSSDEPMTTFVTCLTCNNRWKFC
jgi:transcription elongation factor S-II